MKNENVGVCLPRVDAILPSPACPEPGAPLSPPKPIRRREKANLSRRAVDDALANRTPGKRLRVWFKDPTGLFLNVTPNGDASYYLSFRRADGFRSESVIAKENQVTPSEAGVKARQMLAEMIRTGTNPVQARRDKAAEARAAKLKTFRALSEAFMAAPENQGVAERTLETREGLLRKILPIIGERQASELKRADLRDCVREIQKQARTKREGDPKAGNRRANQARSFLSQIFSWAQDNEILETNPASFRAMFDGKPKKRVGKMSEEKLRAFWTGLKAEANEQKFAEGKSIALAIRLVAVTLQRPNEVCGAHVMDFDWTAKLWRCPEDRTKTNVVYEIPLSDLAVELFKEAFALSGCEWAFPGKAGEDAKKPVRSSVTERHWRRLRARLLKAKAIPDLDCQLYDLRRFGRTRLQHGLGFAKDVAERCLNHAQPGDIGSVYDCEDYLPLVRRALDGWAMELKRVVGEQDQPADGRDLEIAAA